MKIILSLLIILPLSFACSKQKESQILEQKQEINIQDCSQSLKNLIVNSDINNPFKSEFKTSIDKEEDNKITVKLSTESDAETAIAWVIIDLRRKLIFDITNDIEHPITLKYKNLDWDNFIKCLKQENIKLKTMNTIKIQFSDLFNESSNIQFAPEDLNKNQPEIEQFKSKLSKFESSNPKPQDFNMDDLLLLIDNKTFTNNEKLINSNWLGYFINKYTFNQRIIDSLMNTAIIQEDYPAIKILGKDYIFSKNQIETAKSKKNYKDTLHGKIDTDEYYDPSYSKIDEVLSFITISFSKNHIVDSNGYTNLRTENNAKSSIIQKIKSGEHIEVLDNSEDWFLIKTKEGKEGYIHKSRIKTE